jgi:sensor histidine kinase regulating citrate/malate metabolism
MSRIYDALIRAGKGSEPSVTVLQRPKADRTVYFKWWQAASLDRRIFTTVASVIGIFGVAVVILVYQFVGRALRSEIDERGRVLATALSDAAAGYVAGKNVLELDALTAKFSRLDGVAYIVIENANGDTVIDSSRGILREDQRTRAGTGAEQAGMLISDAANRSVDEFRAPILDGQLGTARIAVWREDVQARISGALLPILAAIVVLLLASFVTIFFLLRLLIGRATALSATANSVSNSDLDSPISNGAVG